MNFNKTIRVLRFVATWPHSWRHTVLSRRVLAVAVAAVLVYTAVFYFVLTAISSPSRSLKPHQHQYRLASMRQGRPNSHRGTASRHTAVGLGAASGVRARNPARNVDSSERGHPPLDSSLGRWFPGWVNWFRGGGPLPTQPCMDDDCEHFRFPEELPESVRNVCGDNRLPARVPLVVLVSSHAQGFEERQALRETWLVSNKSELLGAVRHLFVVGQSGNEIVEAILQNETKQHGDILQGYFRDAALSSPIYRALLGLYWVSRHCLHADHVLKVDQDAWINLPQLLSHLAASPPRIPVGLAGYCTDSVRRAAVYDRLQESPLARNLEPGMRRNLISQQWRAQQDNAVNAATFFPPPNCHEAGYFMTPSVAAELVLVSAEVPISTTLENIYLGLCLRRLRLEVETVPGFSLSPRDSSWITNLCQLHGSKVVLRRGFTPKEMRFIWAESKCRGKLIKRRKKLAVGLPQQ